MSDGPHRSLPMSTGWKKVAKRAANSNFDRSEVAEAMAAQLIRDFRGQIPERTFALLKKEFREREGDLFPYERAQRHEIARALEGSSLGLLLLDCVEQGLNAGHVGQQGLEAAMQSAVQAHALKQGRQIEEHYQRDQGPFLERVDTVRRGIEGAIEILPAEAVSKQILQPKPSRTAPMRQRSGIDVGVPLL